MKSPYDIIKSLMHTEKETNLLKPSGKYLFFVDKSSNKIEIKQSVEHIYKVKVKSVNTMIAAGKSKRVRYQAGYTPDWKKAIVTLKEGQKIDLA